MAPKLPLSALAEGEDPMVALQRVYWRRSGLHWGRLPGLAPRPETVIDVGASNGTPGLYEAFPNAKFVLIDPLVENREPLEAWKSRYDATVIIAAVGATPGEMAFDVPAEGPTGKSSFLKRAGAYADTAMIPRMVEIRRLDDLIPDAPGSIGLKIDAEGYEREVALGAPRVLARTSWVVCEISMAPRFVGDPLFAGVYQALDAAGFVFRDIVEFSRQGVGDMRRIDAVFVRREFVDYPRERRTAREARKRRKARTPRSADS